MRVEDKKKKQLREASQSVEDRRQLLKWKLNLAMSSTEWDDRAFSVKIGHSWKIH